MPASAPTLSNQRLITLDIAKGIGMLFVIFAHVNYTPKLLILIYSFHMPLHFILSGFLFDRNRYSTYSAFFRRRWQTLLLPYLIASVISIGYIAVWDLICPAAAHFSRQEYRDYIIQIFLAQQSSKVLNSPLWFIPCLMLVESIYYFLSNSKKTILIPACVLLTAFGWILGSKILPFDNTMLLWNLDSGLFALSFYAFGNLCAPYFRKVMDAIRQHKHKALICIGGAVLILLIWLPLALMNGKISLGSKILKNGFLLYATGILGTLAVLLGSILLEKWRWLSWIGCNSFFLMSCHFLIRKFTLTKYYNLLGIVVYNRKSLRQSILPFFIVLALSIGLTLLWNWAKESIQNRHTQQKSSNHS